MNDESNAFEVKKRVMLVREERKGWGLPRERTRFKC
jgi:hypothetical protein